MKSAHKFLAPGKDYQHEVWFNQYYQMGNRLTFLVMLRERGVNVRLVLLNIVDNPTYIKTTEEQWQQHYQKAFSEMLGTSKEPEGVFVVYFKV